MYRILFLVRSLEIGGAERQLVELVKNMDRNRFDILIVSFYDGGALRPLLEKIPGVNVVSLGKKTRWDLITFFFRLVKVIKNYRPDVIQSYLDVPNSFNVLVGKLLGIKTSLGASASFVDFSRYDWTASLVYKTGAFLSHFSDIVIANSNAGEKYNIQQGYSAKKITVIHNGIDTRIFHPDTSEGIRLREKWGLDPKDKVIGLVGRIDPMKDHPTFLQAAALVISKFPDCNFVCIGRGVPDYQLEMKALAATLLDKDKVLWIHDCADEDLPGAFNAFDILVLSSYGEGLPVVVGEGMSSGLPCAVTNVGDSAFAVGDTGLVVPPQNPMLLADAICKLLSLSVDDRKALGQKARKRVQDHFSIEKMTAAYENVFEKLAKE